MALLLTCQPLPFFNNMQEPQIWPIKFSYGFPLLPIHALHSFNVSPLPLLLFTHEISFLLYFPQPLLELSLSVFIYCHLILIVHIYDTTTYTSRLGLVASLCRDSPSMRLYDIIHYAAGGEDQEPAVITRSITPDPGTCLSTFSWHPTHENRLLGASYTGVACCIQCSIPVLQA